jgi:hypothetical protein
MFAVPVDASAGWRGVKITPAISRELDALMTDSKAKPGVGLAAQLARQPALEPEVTRTSRILPVK